MRSTSTTTGTDAGIAPPTARQHLGRLDAPARGDDDRAAGQEDGGDQLRLFDQPAGVGAQVEHQPAACSRVQLVFDRFAHFAVGAGDELGERHHAELDAVHGACDRGHHRLGDRGAREGHGATLGWPVGRVRPCKPAPAPVRALAPAE